jgi:outer membrane protein TolC
VIGAALLVGLLQAAAGDTVPLTEFQRSVARHHPVAQAAELAVRRARFGVSLARGAFDPTVSAVLEQKRFKGIGYYDELELRALMPTPLGIDFKLGWERADGQIINPERATPLEGLLTASVVVPLGRRIITDERRTALKQADAQAVAAVADRTRTVLALLSESARAYGAWYDASQRAVIAREAERLAEFRLEAVRSRVRTGDAAAIDSIEARLEVRARSVARLEAENDALAARTAAGVFVWTEQGRAVALPPAQVPVAPAAWRAAPSQADEDGVAEWVRRSHPLVVRAEARVAELRAGRTLARQNLLPDAKVELGALNAGSAFGDLFNLGEVGTNQKVSGTASQSLLLAKERARLGQADVGVDVGEWELSLAREQAVAALRIAGATWRALEAQRARQVEAVADALALVQGEQRRFEAGESSLLIVNLRERALVTERNALARIEGRLLAAEAAYELARGDVGGTTR